MPRINSCPLLPLLPLMLLFFFLLGTLPAAALTPDEVVTQVQKKYDATGAFKAHFRQEAHLKTTGTMDTAEGWVYFKKPCQMRWQYLSPAEQRKEILADGNQVWMYIPQDRMVMVYPIKQVLRSDLVMRFFSGIGSLKDDFKITWNRPNLEGKPYQIDLVPIKPQSELKQLTLTIDPKTYLVQALEFNNAYGDKTLMTLTQPQLNIKLEPNFFTFTPPPGVEVVKDMMK